MNLPLLLQLRTSSDPSVFPQRKNIATRTPKQIMIIRDIEIAVIQIDTFLSDNSLSFKRPVFVCLIKTLSLTLLYTS